MAGFTPGADELETAAGQLFARVTDWAMILSLPGMSVSLDDVPADVMLGLGALEQEKAEAQKQAMQRPNG